MAICVIAVVGVPMPRAGREPDDIAGTNFFDRLALALHPAEAGRDDQRLPERMGMPGGTGARLEGDAAAGRACGFGRLK